jgi:hypothetical protein
MLRKNMIVYDPNFTERRLKIINNPIKIKRANEFEK